MGRCRVRSCDIPWSEIISLIDKPAPADPDLAAQVDAIMARHDVNPERLWVRGPAPGAHARMEVCESHARRVTTEVGAWKTTTSEWPAPTTWLVPA